MISMTGYLMNWRESHSAIFCQAGLAITLDASLMAASLRQQTSHIACTHSCMWTMESLVSGLNMN